MPTIPPNWRRSSPSGVPYHFLLYYAESFARDTNMSKAKIECTWENSQFLKADFFERAVWVPAGPGAAFGRLTRRLPLTSAYYPGVHWLDRMDFDGFQGEKVDAAHIGSSVSGWPAIDGYAQFTLTFTNREYDLLEDAAADAASDAINAVTANSCTPEQTRFLRVSERYMPEARRTPGAGLEVYDDGIGPGPHPVADLAPPLVPGEIGAVPTVQIEITAEMIFWPFGNRPKRGMAACAGCVNNFPFYINGTTYPVGTLIYKGPATDLTPYRWIDGGLYTNVAHLFGYRPQGWNYYRLPKLTTAGRQWYPIRIRDTAATPLFTAADFRLLFTPELP